MSNTPPKEHMFILDFDGTITTKDTISTLAHSTIQFRLQNGTDRTKAWADAVLAYVKDYEEFVQSYEPAERNRKTIGEEVEFLRELKDVEGRSFERVSQSGIFAEVPAWRLEQFGREAVEERVVGIRKGFTKFISKISTQGKWGIVSVNFSLSWICGVVESAGVNMKDIPIFANEPAAGLLRGVWGDAGRRELICTSEGKEAAMKSLIKKVGAESGQVVYIGDSSTDLECLTAQGVVGIVVSEDGKGSLMNVLRRIGVEVRHIGEYSGIEKEEVFWARDFDEVTNVMFR